ncbi:MAG: SCO family protein [Verrucomicrobia bacterium]|nr:SCO family protein [Verrucomicrobiota bacterium]
MKVVLYFLSMSLLVAAESATQVGQLNRFEPASRSASFTPSPGKPGTLVTVALQPGDLEIAWAKQVRCTLVQRDGKLSAEGVVSAEPEELRQEQQVVEDLRRDTFERGRIVMRGANDLMPMMALWDQDGRFQLKKDFLGAPLAINFVFTSCQNARMCPASTSAMRKLADELAQRPALANVRLVTITFDPEVDTPGVLRTYAQGYGIDFKRHSFLTGREAHIKDLMRHYGILTTRSDGTILHNAALVIVSPEGRIIQRREGAVFDSAEVAEYFARLAEPSKSR